MEYLLTTLARNGDDSFIVAFTMPYFDGLSPIEMYFSSILRNIMYIAPSKHGGNVKRTKC